MDHLRNPVYLAYFLLVFLAGVIMYPIVKELLTPTPYSKVAAIVPDVWEEDSVVLRYSFKKNGECSLKTFAVLGYSDGVPRYLKYEDLDGLGENFDREEGDHSLNIKVLLEGGYFDKIVVRTRHDCSGTMIQKVFTESKNETR